MNAEIMNNICKGLIGILGVIASLFNFQKKLTKILFVIIFSIIYYAMITTQNQVDKEKDKKIKEMNEQIMKISRDVDIEKITKEVMEEKEKTLYEEMTKISPDNFLGYFKLAIYYEKNKKVDNAVKNYGRAFKLAKDEKNPSIYNTIGMGYYKLADSVIGQYKKELYKKAKESLEKSISKAKGDSNREVRAKAYNNLGCVYESMGEMKKALESFRKAEDDGNPRGKENYERLKRNR